ncbi:hypothetical protein BpHYR1_047064, partial [Brachionus plicatilis]
VIIFHFLQNTKTQKKKKFYLCFLLLLLKGANLVLIKLVASKPETIPSSSKFKSKIYVWTRILSKGSTKFALQHDNHPKQTSLKFKEFSKKNNNIWFYNSTIKSKFKNKALKC